jgi:hypothetical protein
VGVHLYDDSSIEIERYGTHEIVPLTFAELIEIAEEIRKLPR